MHSLRRCDCGVFGGVGFAGVHSLRRCDCGIFGDWGFNFECFTEEM